ncbi:hypothetical protein AMELA_G00196690 [Ameiurus melas]|uniref:Uncharacterized protein n=1 Tax=Ameiurus melas TaxID=219545 RepID=A0A7J6A5V5_AMEME|nr:hypothetical protein AMELA_G00196690 [Ameiurus melas]
MNITLNLQYKYYLRLMYDGGVPGPSPLNGVLEDIYIYRMGFFYPNHVCYVLLNLERFYHSNGQMDNETVRLQRNF